MVVLVLVVILRIQSLLTYYIYTYVYACHLLLHFVVIRLKCH